MAEEVNSVDLVDKDFFESRKQVGEDFVEKLFQVFSQEAPKLIQKIIEIAETDNKEKLVELGHKLKGMCLNVGAGRLSFVGKQIELSAKSGEKEALNELIKGMDSVLENTLSEMENLIK